MRVIKYREAINEAMVEEMTRDETVIYIGEDVSVGVWGTAEGLFDKFGPERVRDTAISETAVCGSCIGMAMAGYRPIADIMFADFVAIAGDEVLNQASSWRFETGGGVTIPLVYRVPIGGYARLGPYHSQCMEAVFWHFPGLKIAIPSTPYDAKGLLKTAIRDNNPVVYLEHKRLMATEGEVPEEEYTIPFGVADIKRPGDDVTVIATGYMVPMALNVASKLEEERGISLEVIDPRTLEPLDIDTIVSSVKKTKRAVIADEDTMRCGVGAEIGMQIMENAFDFLDCPIKRIGRKNFPIPAGWVEKYVLPQPEDIISGIESVLG
jgi:pyruvate/2-oxoglutarate/acetoin dehydrogenase E1 component